uniref:Uncharacterized protein n=1 Tax=Rhizophora mucronata TaxID=61149 RepID=A0A2P2IQC0_RHIMU
MFSRIDSFGGFCDSLSDDTYGNFVVYFPICPIITDLFFNSLYC